RAAAVRLSRADLSRLGHGDPRPRRGRARLVHRPDAAGRRGVPGRRGGPARRPGERTRGSVDRGAARAGPRGGAAGWQRRGPHGQRSGDGRAPRGRPGVGVRPGVSGLPALYCRTDLQSVRARRTDCKSVLQRLATRTRPLLCRWSFAPVPRRRTMRPLFISTGRGNDGSRPRARPRGLGSHSWAACPPTRRTCPMYRVATVLATAALAVCVGRAAPGGGKGGLDEEGFITTWLL